MNRDGLKRPDPSEIELFYYAEADADFVTLFPSPLHYDAGDDRYTPRYQRWGFGLRYIEKTHAENIISDQLRIVERELASSPDESRRAVMEREIVVLHNLYDRYIGSATGVAWDHTKATRKSGTFGGIPDKELGELGEKHIYERELLIAAKLSQSASQVKWVSRANPQSPFDIRTIRQLSGAVLDHYIEVKSTTVLDDTHIFVSAREKAFLDEHKDNCSVVLVRFNPDKSVKDVRDFTIDQLRERYEFVPVAFKLRPLI